MDTYKQHQRDVRDAYLITAADAVHWSLDSVYQDTPLIRRGGDGAWDNDQVRTAEHPQWYSGTVLLVQCWYSAADTVLLPQ